MYKKLSSSQLSLSPPQFLLQNPHIKRLMASAIVFRTPSPSPSLSSTHPPPPPQPQPQPQMLLLRRAASDSYPLRWEIPGGSTSPTDETLVASAVRELHEETALVADQVLYAVDMITPAPEHALTNLGISAAEENARNEGDEVRTVTFLETGRRWGKVTLVVSVNGGTEHVQLRDEEHDRWAWATEEEVRLGRWRDGEEIEFVSEGVWRTILEGFRVHGEGR